MITFGPMRRLLPLVRARVRTLSLGPVPDGAWSWTYHTGAAWIALAWDDDQLVAWAALTKEADDLPVVGVYVRPDYRGESWAVMVARTLIRNLMDSGDLYSGAAVFAAVERWPQWANLLESFGLRCIEWQ